MSDSTDMPHLLVVDDDRRIRTLLQRFLQRHNFLVSVAHNAHQAGRLLDALLFDLLIIDIMMPGEDGLSFTQRLRTRCDTPVILLTARGEIRDRIAGLEAGADDYLAKPFEPRELLLRISAILRRAVPEAAATETAPRIVRLGGRCYDPAQGELRQGDTIVRLTTTEQSLMHVLSRHIGAPVDRLRLAQELGSPDNMASERAVDVQITRLRRKIEGDPKNPRYLQTVRGAGYMLISD